MAAECCKLYPYENTKVYNNKAGGIFGIPSLTVHSYLDVFMSNGTP